VYSIAPVASSYTTWGGGRLAEAGEEDLAESGDELEEEGEMFSEDEGEMDCPEEGERDSGVSHGRNRLAASASSSGLAPPSSRSGVSCSAIAGLGF
jgi:hypothetical protein